MKILVSTLETNPDLSKTASIQHKIYLARQEKSLMSWPNKKLMDQRQRSPETKTLNIYISRYRAVQTFEQILEARRVFSLQPISLPDSSASICHLLNRAREKERRDGRGGGSVMCSNFSCAPTASLFHFTMIPRVSLSPLFIHF